MVKVFFESALLPDGWADNVSVTWDDAGIITAVDIGAVPDDAERLSGIALPGLANLHSHAFQRAMAGLAEVASPGDDSFWTWREVMYGFLASLSPDDVEAIASQLYAEVLKAGYTGIAEFHYLHHRPDGGPYDNPAEMSERIAAAAAQTGIALCHLPVLYAHGGFGGADISAGQGRFHNDVEAYLRLRDSCRAENVGVAFHSLRAVTEAEMTAVLAAVPDGPVHIHIAEQVKEVDDCLAWSGARPVEWLLDHLPVDERWCLVHATHLSEREIANLAASGAVAGLCPTTEANLGDGVFPARAYLDAGGRFGIGSDSHISTSLADELRSLEYSQRLRDLARNVLTAGDGSANGRLLFDIARMGGAQATGRASGLALGHPADFIVLDPDHPALVGRRRDQVLNAWLFFNGGNPVRDVYVAGKRVIADGHHVKEEAIASRYARTMRKLLD